MISPLLRALLVSGLVIGGLVGSALGGHAQPLAGPPPPNPRTPPPTPLATPLAVPPTTRPADYPAPCHRANASNSRAFPETGQAVGGDFGNYWERNGGLAQQGFPLSPLITEVSELDGKPYQVQY